MSRFPGRAMAAAVVLGVSAAVVLLIGGVANAAPPTGTLGSLTLTPPIGSDITVPEVTTSAGCPNDPNDDSYNVAVNGPGGINNLYIVSTTSADINHNGPFTTPFGRSFKDVAGLQGVVPGEYDVTLQCLNGFTGQLFGTFTTAMYFTSPTQYTTTPPLTPIPTPSPTPLPTPIPSPTPPPAGTLGSLTLTPTTGSDATYPMVTTSAACPNDPNDDSYNVVVNGPGGFNNVYMVSTTSAGINHNGPFTTVFSASFRDVAGLQGVVPGEYDVTLQCVNGFTWQLFGTFTTAVVFDSPTTYHVFTPTTTPTPSPSPIPTPTPTPNPGATATTTTLQAAPNLGFTFVPEILIARVSPVSAAGTVQFKDGNTALGTPVRVTGGLAFLITPLPVGMHSLSAMFNPTNTRTFSPSTSSPPVSVTIRSLF